MNTFTKQLLISSWSNPPLSSMKNQKTKIERVEEPRGEIRMKECNLERSSMSAYLWVSSCPVTSATGGTESARPKCKWVSSWDCWANPCPTLPEVHPPLPETNKSIIKEIPPRVGLARAIPTKKIVSPLINTSALICIPCIRCWMEPRKESGFPTRDTLDRRLLFGKHNKPRGEAR